MFHILAREKNEKFLITDSSFRASRLVFAVDQGSPPFYACEICFWTEVFIALSLWDFY